MKYDLEKLKESIKINFCLADVIKDLNIKKNGRTYQDLKKIIKDNNINISHFLPNKSHLNVKYPIGDKICPVCDSIFKERIGNPKEKVTCSKSCSNTFFRSGQNNGNWIPLKEKTKKALSSWIGYRKQFDDSKLICKRCGYNEFKSSVQIHHLDHNRLNNNMSNLIPLCANCHFSLHKKLWKIEDIMECEANNS